MDITLDTMWNGFRKLHFTFEDRQALIVIPENRREDGKWLYKTEYFGAFPSFELEMLEKGYYVAHVKNNTRWSCEEDIEMRPRFCEFLHKEFGLSKTCMPVGMSCGGMQAVYFAARYPEYVAALYLDAPVMNLLSCPGGIGDGEDYVYYEEFTKQTGLTMSQLINYRQHPIDMAPALVAANIPIMLVSGDRDREVPFHENGQYLYDYYREHGGTIELIIKEGGDHHPHGLEDTAPLHAFAERYY